MALDADKLFADMLSAGTQAFGAGWQKAKTFATHEFQTIASRLVQIAEGVTSHEFDDVTAKILLRMQINNSVSLIAAMTTLILKAVEDAINAALAVIKKVVNDAVGFLLIA